MVSLIIANEEAGKGVCLNMRGRTEQTVQVCDDDRTLASCVVVVVSSEVVVVVNCVMVTKSC